MLRNSVEYIISNLFYFFNHAKCLHIRSCQPFLNGFEMSCFVQVKPYKIRVNCNGMKGLRNDNQ